MTIGYQVYNQQATYFVTWQSGDCLVARTKLAGLQKLSPQTSPNSEKDTTANWGMVHFLFK